jgi:hypothetical protein
VVVPVTVCKPGFGFPVVPYPGEITPSVLFFLVHARATIVITRAVNSIEENLFIIKSGKATVAAGIFNQR